MYVGAESQVQTSGGSSLTEKFPVNVGVHQGNILSPLLFNIFLNDFNHVSPNDSAPSIFKKKVSCLLYADDMVILSTTASGLQESLDHLDTYCNKWGLEVNAEKSHVITFRKSKKLKTNVAFYLQGNIIRSVENCNYLGFNLHSNGRTDLLQSTLVAKASRALFSLYKMPGFKNISIIQQLQLFNSLIKPILMYGSEVWGIHPLLTHLKKHNNYIFGSLFNRWSAQKVATRFCRNILGLHSKAPILPMLGDLGMYPLYIDILISSVKYWMSIMSKGKVDSLVYQAMLEAYSINTNTNIYNATSGLHDIVNYFNFPEIWDNLGGSNIYMTSTKLKKCMQLDFVKYWYNEISNQQHSRYLFYHQIKTNFNFENYLNIDSHKLRSCITRLRGSTHTLLVEKGRHLGLKREDRLCSECSTLDDENHFLFTCKKFSAMRHLYFEKFDPTVLLNLFQNGTIKELINLAKFINAGLFT